MGTEIWPLFPVSGLAWLVLVAATPPLVSPALCGPDGGSVVPDVPDRMSLAVALNASVLWPLSWLAMAVAMMLPLVWSPVLHVWRSSLVGRRSRAVALFLVGYLGLWWAAIAVLWCVALLAASFFPDMALGIALASAASWHLTAHRRTLVSLCHRRPPLPAFGFAAERASLAFGLTTAGACIAVCWAVMLVPFAGSAYHLPLMMGAAGLMFAERYGGTRRTVFGANPIARRDARFGRLGTSIRS